MHKPAQPPPTRPCRSDVEEAKHAADLPKGATTPPRASRGGRPHPAGIGRTTEQAAVVGRTLRDSRPAGGCCRVGGVVLGVRNGTEVGTRRSGWAAAVVPIQFTLR